MDRGAILVGIRSCWVVKGFVWAMSSNVHVVIVARRQASMKGIRGWRGIIEATTKSFDGAVLLWARKGGRGKDASTCVHTVVSRGP